jgi:hypothetical protein
MLVSEPATHHEERSIISDEDVSSFEDVCLRMPAVFVTGTFGFISSPGVEDGLPRFMKASDVLAREESFARECDLRQARELPRLRDSTSPDEICELFGKLTRRSVVPAPLWSEDHLHLTTVCQSEQEQRLGVACPTRI